ncbi:hypothetical protein OF83DRAFT_1172914 [Amylostereum chailletii]|nr:hypothetical protein OF83DRAFT_1172914 [Amylostereum chailletii]
MHTHLSKPSVTVFASPAPDRPARDAPDPAPPDPKTAPSLLASLLAFVLGTVHEIRGNPSRSPSAARILLKLPLTMALTYAYRQTKLLLRTMVLPLQVCVQAYEYQLRVALPRLPSLGGVLTWLYSWAVNLVLALLIK